MTTVRFLKSKAIARQVFGVRIEADDHHVVPGKPEEDALQGFPGEKKSGGDQAEGQGKRGQKAGELHGHRQVGLVRRIDGKEPQ